MTNNFSRLLKKFINFILIVVFSQNST